MPLTFEEVGGIAIPFPDATEQQVQRELSRLDRGLFLDKEWEPHGPHGGYAYHVVKHRVAENVVIPIAGTEWRTADGPKPLTMAIVERVRRNENQLEGAGRWAADRNRRIQERARQDASEQMDDIVRDFARAGRIGNFAMVPRSRGLYLARAKKRSGQR